MTDRIDPAALPIFAGPAPPDTPPNGHQVPTNSLGPTPLFPTSLLPTHLAPTRPGPRSLAGPIGTSRPPPPVTTPQRPAPVPADEPRPAGVAPEGIDWQQVAMLRAQATDQLTAALGDERGMDPHTERELGRTIIQELLQTTAADRLHDGEAAWSMNEQDAMAEAVYNALFGLGRLQPLVDDDSIENIIIIGAHNVWVEKIDGTLIKVDPVADSDQELLDFLSFVASRSEVNARSFSSANPRLHMRLDGGSRLAAAAWVTAHPSVVIRRHRLRRITLDELVERNMISHTQATFLRAAVQARKSVVVAGHQGAGKTTMLRALCAEIHPWEAIGTFETEFELHLHELPDVHPIVHAWEARPGSGEVGPDGKQAGEFTLNEALYDSFRFNLSRDIIGEVRGREIWVMIKAMESGTGSMSTTHAGSAEGAIRKLVTCAMEAGPHVTKELATSKLAETVDLVAQIHMETVPLGHGKFRRSRWVSEIVHIAPGEAAKGYAITHVFRPNPAGGPGTPGTLPDELRDLEQYGFDINAYLAESGREEA